MTKNAGFTLIELLVSIFLFSIMATITTGIFVKSLELERRSFSAQMIQENALAVFELMAKEIRVGKINSSDSNCTSSILSIEIQNPSSPPPTIDVIYQLDSTSGIVQRIYNGVTYLASTDDVVFNSLKFCILNSGIDDQAARVTILASVSNRVGKVLTANLQTTITSRDVSLELEN
ncbi:MAG: hypothetical protein A2817_03590 [Candidatus Yanofskybacteria bacterium RIFCSPHIGHO2_01_FULL_39_8b]|uniref:Type II secretion system protein J n=1 Tax=Candidatus Yanofskybacteria bacterium RIFCSPHIGHO2_01_FULL_39_8b TaxID=1802659 RepID=A0A1F8E8U2_9BACT|nr:MAG: hypothetical protein A2817_03590 [Candidatus Yanofskybacteria bacterium RIFCSPHIGHO2_01_FULL_39_8b]